MAATLSYYVGQTLPVLSLTFQDDTGAVVNLTGATLSVVIRNIQTLQDSAGAGSFTIVNANTGQATYALAASDTAVAGTFSLIFKLTFSSGLIICDPISWQVTPI